MSKNNNKAPPPRTHAAPPPMSHHKPPAVQEAAPMNRTAARGPPLAQCPYPDSSFYKCPANPQLSVGAMSSNPSLTSPAQMAPPALQNSTPINVGGMSSNRTPPPPAQIVRPASLKSTPSNVSSLKKTNLMEHMQSPMARKTNKDLKEDHIVLPFLPPIQTGLDLLSSAASRNFDPRDSNNKAPPSGTPKNANQSPNVSFRLPKNIEIRKSPTTSSIAAQSSVTMNKLDSQDDSINPDNLQCFETNEQVMMLFDTIGNEVGDRGDSDGEGDEMLLIDFNTNQSIEETLERDLIEADVDAYDIGAIPGSPKNWEPPQPPSNFKPYEPKFGAPPWERINNHGKWCQYTYQPKYAKGKYLGHFTPGGATVIPPNANGERKCGDWEFYYNGYNANEVDRNNYVRGGADSENHMPDSRSGKLDGELLKKHGLTIERVKSCDALFLFNLLLPIHIPKLSGVEDDNRMQFFSIVRAWTNMYAFSPERNWGGSYGHGFQSVSEEELVRWFGELIRDGARGGTGGAIHRRWMLNDVDHDDCIMNSMSYYRWIKIKSVLKLNNNDKTPKQGDVNYNPCAKYDYIFKATTTT